MAADGQVAKGRVQRVAGPPAAMQQLKDQIVLVPFADRPQHGGQPVAQGPEPAELVQPGSEIAMPGDQPGGSRRGADSRLGLLADCGRIAGLAAASSHRVPFVVASARDSILKAIFQVFAHSARLTSVHMPGGDRLRVTGRGLRHESG